MKKILANNGSEILVCDQDYHLLSKMKWNVSSEGYARTYWHKHRVGTFHMHMHVLIKGKNKGLVVDHINRNKLDNRRCNLRFLDKAKNALNTTKQSRTGLPKGVRRSRKKWAAYASVKDKYVHLGIFDSIEKASEARIAFYENIHGRYILPSSIQE